MQVEQSFNKEQSVQIDPKQSVVQKLRERAEKSPVFTAMCSMFAMRERTRQQIVLNTLLAVMKNDTVKFSKEQLAEELKFMASIGLGTIQHDKKNRVYALKNIKTKLQSIGHAALSKTDHLVKFTPQAKFSDLPKRKTDFLEPRTTIIPEKYQYKAVLNIDIEGHKVEFTIDNSVPLQELLTALSNLYKTKNNV